MSEQEPFSFAAAAKRWLFRWLSVEFGGVLLGLILLDYGILGILALLLFVAASRTRCGWH